LSLSSLARLDQDYAQHQDPQLLIKQYSSLLRRVALAQFSRAEVASLTGSSWLDFLDQSAEQKLFNTEAGQLLITAPYQKPDIKFDKIDELSKTIQAWFKAISSNKPEQTDTKAKVNQS